MFPIFSSLSLSFCASSTTLFSPAFWAEISSYLFFVLSKSSESSEITETLNKRPAEPNTKNSVATVANRPSIIFFARPSLKLTNPNGVDIVTSVCLASFESVGFAFGWEIFEISPFISTSLETIGFAPICSFWVIWRCGFTITGFAFGWEIFGILKTSFS